MEMGIAYDMAWHRLLQHQLPVSWPISAGHAPPDPSRPAGQAVTVALVGSPGPGKTAHLAPLRPL
jgi:hypothetical protein